MEWYYKLLIILILLILVGTIYFKYMGITFKDIREVKNRVGVTAFDHPSIIENKFKTEIGSKLNLKISNKMIDKNNQSLGYLVKPVNNNSYPVIILIYDGIGKEGEGLDIADTIASEGYITLAIDISELNSSNKNTIIKHTKEGITYLKENLNVDSFTIIEISLATKYPFSELTTDFENKISFYNITKEEFSKFENLNSNRKEVKQIWEKLLDFLEKNSK